MLSSRTLRLLVAIAVLPAAAARGIDVVIDYRYDTTGFFSAESTNGQAARATVEAAAQFFSNLITDSLLAIPFTDPTTPGSTNFPVWRQVVTHPGNGQEGYAISSAAYGAQDGLSTHNPYPVANEFRDIQIPANQWLVYVGGAGLSVTGLGGTGVAYYGAPSFNDLIDNRGRTSFGYATWGGYAIFDGDGSTNWHYDHTTAVPAGKIDLYSVALHELGHTLGLNGDNAEWNLFQDNGIPGAETWNGPQTLAAWKREDPNAPDEAYGIPTVNDDDHHWQNNEPGQPLVPAVRSYVLGTRTLQEASMDPIIAAGTRKLMTNVDVLALADIGWQIDKSQIILPGDLNIDGVVDGADLAIWDASMTTSGSTAGDVNNDGVTDGADLLALQQQLNIGEAGLAPTASAVGAVPEPATFVLAATALGVAALRRSRRAPLACRQ